LPGDPKGTGEQRERMADKNFQLLPKEQWVTVKTSFGKVTLCHLGEYSAKRGLAYTLNENGTEVLYATPVGRVVSFFSKKLQANFFISVECLPDSDESLTYCLYDDSWALVATAKSASGVLTKAWNVRRSGTEILLLSGPQRISCRLADVCKVSDKQLSGGKSDNSLDLISEEELSGETEEDASSVESTIGEETPSEKAANAQLMEFLSEQDTFEQDGGDDMLADLVNVSGRTAMLDAMRGYASDGDLSIAMKAGGRSVMWTNYLKLEVFLEALKIGLKIDSKIPVSDTEDNRKAFFEPLVDFLSSKGFSVSINGIRSMVSSVVSELKLPKTIGSAIQHLATNLSDQTKDLREAREKQVDEFVSLFSEWSPKQQDALLTRLHLTAKVTMACKTSRGSKEEQMACAFLSNKFDYLSRLDTIDGRDAKQFFELASDTASWFVDIHQQRFDSCELPYYWVWTRSIRREITEARLEAEKTMSKATAKAHFPATGFSKQEKDYFSTLLNFGGPKIIRLLRGKRGENMAIPSISTLRDWNRKMSSSFRAPGILTDVIADCIRQLSKNSFLVLGFDESDYLKDVSPNGISKKTDLGGVITTTVDKHKDALRDCKNWTEINRQNWEAAALNDLKEKLKKLKAGVDRRKKKLAKNRGQKSTVVLERNMMSATQDIKDVEETIKILEEEQDAKRRKISNIDGPIKSDSTHTATRIEAVIKALDSDATKALVFSLTDTEVSLKGSSFALSIYCLRLIH